MRVSWTSKALGDVARLHAFLAPVNPKAAATVVRKLTAAPKVLATQPRIGTPLSEFAPREVRRLIVGDYEVRYELTPDVAFILRVWHTREDR